MAITLTLAQSDNMADSLNTDIGVSHKLRFYTSGDALLATCVYSAASATVGAANPVALTWAHANYTDDTSATPGTCSYATIETSADAEMVRFSDPVNDISLSSTTIGTTVDVNADIVVQMPNHT